MLTGIEGTRSVFLKCEVQVYNRIAPQTAKEGPAFLASLWYDIGCHKDDKLRFRIIILTKEKERGTIDLPLI